MFSYQDVQLFRPLPITFQLFCLFSFFKRSALCAARETVRLSKCSQFKAFPAILFFSFSDIRHSSLFSFFKWSSFCLFNLFIHSALYSAGVTVQLSNSSPFEGLSALLLFSFFKYSSLCSTRETVELRKCSNFEPIQPITFKPLCLFSFWKVQLFLQIPTHSTL